MIDNELRSKIDILFEKLPSRIDKLFVQAKKFGQSFDFYKDLKLDETKKAFLYLFYHISLFTSSISTEQLDYIRYLMNLEYFAYEDLLEIMENEYNNEDNKEDLNIILADSKESSSAIDSLIKIILSFIKLASYPYLTYSAYELCSNIMNGSKAIQ